MSFLKSNFVGNKAKGQISKHWLKGNKTRQILRKTNMYDFLIRIRACTYQRVRNVSIL